MKFSFQLGKINFEVGTANSGLGTAAKSSGGLGLAAAWLRGQEGNGSGGNAALISPFQQSVWVYTVVSALAQTVSAIPFRISRGDRSGEHLVTQGPIIDLFSRPHESLNRFRFWEFIVTWYCLRGEVFLIGQDKNGNILPIKKSRQAPAQLLVLPPDQFRHIVNGYDLAGWQFTSAPLSGPIGPQSFTPDEVVHDFLPNPYLFWRGMSPLSVALLAAQTDYASAQFMKGLMLNNADTGVIVRTDQQLSPDQREQIMSALNERKRSAGTADRPLLLWGGAQIIKPTLSSADLQFLEHRKFNRQEICAAFFRTPQSLVGFTEDANRAIHQSERLNFIENSITPFCARLEATVEPIVKSFGADLFGWFDIDSLPILQQARRDRVDTGLKLFSLGYPANSINQSLDLGLPHLPWGDKGYLPLTVQEAGRGVEAAPSPDPNATERDGTTRMDREDRGQRTEDGGSSVFERMLGNLDCQMPNSDCRSAAPGATRGELKEIGNRHTCSGAVADQLLLNRRIRQKKSKLSAFFFEQRKRVLGKLAELSKPVPALSSIDSMQGTPISVLLLLTEIFNRVAEDERLCKKLTPLLREDVGFGCASIRTEVSRPDLNLAPELIAAFLAQRMIKLKEINAITFQSLKSALHAGLENSEAFPGIADRVKRLFQDASRSRAGTIATTETSVAVNTGRFFTMQAANVEKKGWQTMNDGRVRSAHSRAQEDYADGIPLDDPFIVGGEPLMYPGDPSGSADNVINCRCWTYPIPN